MTDLRKQCYDRTFISEFGSDFFWHEGHFCERCGERIYWQTFHLHHKIPKTRGGTDTLENVEALCFRCHHEHHNGKKPCPKKPSTIDS